MNKKLYSIFIVFEVIFSIYITNVIFMVGSIFSLLFLLPVMLVSSLNYIRRIYIYKEYRGILITFFKFMKGRILKTYLTLLPIGVIIFLVLVNLLYYNEILVNTNQYLNSVILLVQLFVLYQSVSIFFISALQLTVYKDKKKKYIYRDSFLMLNAHPVRSFLSMISLFVIGYSSVTFSSYMYMVLLPLSLFAFYISFSVVFEKYMQNNT